MKTKWIITAAAAALVGFSATVQAVPIQGSIQFSGSATFTTGATTTITFANPWLVSTPAPTLDYSAVPFTPNVGNPNVTFTAFSFTGSGVSATLLGAPIVPLWSFTYAGLIYTFNLSALTSATVTDIGGGVKSINIGGYGVATKTGFTDTLAAWSLSGSGTNLTLDVASQNTTATGVGVPDGGTTVLLLGAALSGLGLLRRKLVA